MRGEFGLFIIWIEEKIWKNTRSQLKKLCKEERCVFVQIESYSFWNLQKSIWKFQKWYYKKFITPYTAVIDLDMSEDEILAQMKSKGRYNIRLAEKKWIEVKVVPEDEYNIGKFYDLVSQTTSRDGFSGNSIEYYTQFLHGLDNSKLLLAYYEWEVIAGWIFIFEKDISIYYYGASTSDSRYRNLMAPYLVQWKAIKIAKSIGSHIYDFLWVMTPWDKKSDLVWVTDFKCKLTPHIIEVSSSYIWINKRFKYTLTQIFKNIKKFY